MEEMVVNKIDIPCPRVAHSVSLISVGLSSKALGLVDKMFV